MHATFAWHTGAACQQSPSTTLVFIYAIVASIQAHACIRQAAYTNVGCTLPTLPYLWMQQHVPSTGCQQHQGIGWNGGTNRSSALDATTIERVRCYLFWCVLLDLGGNGAAHTCWCNRSSNLSGGEVWVLCVHGGEVGMWNLVGGGMAVDVCLVKLGLVESIAGVVKNNLVEGHGCRCVWYCSSW